MNNSRRKIDNVSALLSLFLLLLVALFAYLYYVEKNIQSYAKNHEKIIKLQLLNKELDNFSISLNHFSNYDAINKATSDFETTIHSLQKNLKKSYTNNQTIQTKVEEVDHYFHLKRENINYFI